MKKQIIYSICVLLCSLLTQSTFAYNVTNAVTSLVNGKQYVIQNKATQQWLRLDSQGKPLLTTTAPDGNNNNYLITYADGQFNIDFSAITDVNLNQQFIIGNSTDPDARLLVPRRRAASNTPATFALSYNSGQRNLMCYAGALYYISEATRDEAQWVVYDVNFNTSKAVYNDNTKTLNFYYDEESHEGEGTIYPVALDARGDIRWFISGVPAISPTSASFDASFANCRPTSCKNWFSGLRDLLSISGMENLNTSECTNFAAMFQYCMSLQSLDCTHFDTSKAECLSAMFLGTDIESLDLRSFNTRNVTNFDDMFRGSNCLQTIVVSDNFVIGEEASINGMFYNCSSLVGGAGTKYDEENTYGNYARIDGGSENPGYFTKAKDDIKGDFDGDKKITIADLAILISLLKQGGSIDSTADIDGDGNVNVNDVNTLCNRILGVK